MISAIFQPEVSALESQVAALQAQLAAAQQRISLLNETELLAGDSLGALKGAIQKVSSLAPDAIASLRTAVLDLFRGDSNDDLGFGNGNEPINPVPQSGDDGGVAIAHIEEPLNGQMCELTSPWCSLPEDAPHILINQELVEVGSAVTDADVEPNYFDLIPVGNSVAYFRNNETGEIAATYAGFNNKTKAKQWGEFLAVHHSVAAGFEVREAKRLDAFKHELKLWGMSLKQIERLAESDITKSPSRYHADSKLVEAPEVESASPLVEDAPHIASQVDGEVDSEVEAALTSELKLEQEAQPDPQGLLVGDKVEVTSDRHGIELVGQSGIITAATTAGAAVNVAGTMRWFCSDEVALVEASAPRNAADDLFPAVPAAPKPAPTSTPAYNPYPIGRRGAAKNWEAYQAAKAIEREQKALAASVPDEPDF